MNRNLPYEPCYVFFDGNCGTCDLVVRFILKRRHCERFRFLPLQSLQGKALEGQIREGLNLDLSSSLVVWKNGELYSRTKAVFVILGELGFPWNILVVFWLVPRAIRDFVYDLYAKNRYKILGPNKNGAICDLLPPSLKKLFPEDFPEVLPIFKPRSDVFLSAQWRDLVMINFAVPSKVLEPYTPLGTELDDFNGEYLVSLVAFAFARTSIDGVTLPFAADFEEVNLRFYVRRKMQTPEKFRRGVVFIKEIVPHHVIALTARIFYGENYVQEKTSYNCQTQGEEKRLRYTWGKGSGICALEVQSGGHPETLKASSLPEFITEHYFGYSKGRSQKSIEYEVEHPKWRIIVPSLVKLEGPWKNRYPSDITGFMAEVHSVLIAEGSAIRVIRGKVL